MQFYPGDRCHGFLKIMPNFTHATQYNCTKSPVTHPDMTKAPRHHAGFALVAIVVIGIQFHQEYYSTDRPSWLEQLKEILYSASPDADITSYTGRGVQLLLISNEAMPTSKLLTYVQHQRDEWAADNEKITDEQLLHLNYLERVDKEQSITTPIDDPNTLGQSEDDSTI